MEQVCSRCGVEEKRRPLAKCTICFRLYCEACAFSMSGRRFCSQFCAEYFFHEGDEDD